jgi:hypothetical protein
LVEKKHLLMVCILILILPFALSGSQIAEMPENAYQQKNESIGVSIFDKFGNDPLMDLLGKTFDEIEQTLGVPDEQGASVWFGPHNYILYRFKEGFVQFCSPTSIEEKIAVSIIIGPGQQIYGARAGMLFSEIMAVLGAPDLGPRLSINNLYYMDYYLGEVDFQTPEVFISFSSADVDGPTQNIVVKWEAYEYYQKDQQQAAR